MMQRARLGGSPINLETRGFRYASKFGSGGPLAESPLYLASMNGYRKIVPTGPFRAKGRILAGSFDPPVGASANQPVGHNIADRTSCTDRHDRCSTTASPTASGASRVGKWPTPSRTTRR